MYNDRLGPGWPGRSFARASAAGALVCLRRAFTPKDPAPAADQQESQHETGYEDRSSGSLVDGPPFLHIPLGIAEEVTMVAADEGLDVGPHVAEAETRSVSGITHGVVRPRQDHIPQRLQRGLELRR